MRASYLAIALASLAIAGCKPPNDTSNDTPVTPIDTKACEAWDCGALPDDADQVLCPDGVTLSGPTGKCIAHGSECAWEVVSCPETPECEPDDCGPKLTQPNYLCADGETVAGPSGVCEKLRDGTCAWQIVQCSDVN